jgi:hypothetical protein
MRISAMAMGDDGRWTVANLMSEKNTFLPLNRAKNLIIANLEITINKNKTCISLTTNTALGIPMEFSASPEFSLFVSVAILLHLHASGGRYNTFIK